MKLLRIIKYDLRFGLLRQWKVCLLAVFVTLWSMKDYNLFNTRTEKTIMDYWSFIFRGRVPYTFQADGIFILPIFWLILFILPAFIIGDYAKKDLDGYGKNLIIQSGSKVKWAISKILWCVLSVCIYVGIIVATILIYARYLGNSFELSLDGYFAVHDFNLKLSTLQIAGEFFLLPVLSILVTCLLQMTLTMFIEPITAYVIIITYDVLATYVTSPLCIGNYAMNYKNVLLSEGGMNFRYGYPILLVLLLAGIFVYIVKVRRKDII